MLKLYPRGAASRGVCVDVDGAMLGPDTVLVERAGKAFRCASRETMHEIQSVVLGGHRHCWRLYRAGSIRRAADGAVTVIAREPLLGAMIRLLLPSWLSKSNTGTTPVFIDEFDPCGFNGFLQLSLSIVGYPRPKPSFETLYRWKR